MKSVQLLNLKSDRIGLKCTRANDVFDYHTVCGDVYNLFLNDGFLLIRESNDSNPGWRRVTLQAGSNTIFDSM